MGSQVTIDGRLTRSDATKGVGFVLVGIGRVVGVWFDASILPRGAASGPAMPRADFRFDACWLLAPVAVLIGSAVPA